MIVKQAGNSTNCIEIRGARTHNLKNVDLDIPRGGFTVITGVSGSGKSSLAFDTLFAEGQRQYLESLSSYARQYLEQMERPDVDSIRGLQPTLCIDQQQGVLSPRSTVGTVTEIYDFLRLLMARVATPACHQCGKPIERQPATQIVDAILENPANTRISVLAPMVIGRKGAHADVFDRIAKAGLLRVRVDGQDYEMESLPELAVRKEHSISAVVDRIIRRDDSRERIEQAVAVALRLSDGLVEAICRNPEDKTEISRLYSTRYACIHCGINLVEIEPRSFSFNSPYGACPTCEGFGFVGGEKSKICKECHGDRLRKESLAIRLAGESIAQIAGRPVCELGKWLEGLSLPKRQAIVAEPIIKEVLERLRFLNIVGLGYLTLNRPADSLSGGELQRVRLATSIGTGLTGVCYVLDEPSVGLHPCDTQRLIETLHALQRKGNTLVIVEHDEEMMRAADLLVDIGPSAGIDGGAIVAMGEPRIFQTANSSTRFPKSSTALHLGGKRNRPESKKRSVDLQHPRVLLRGVTINNLVDVCVEFPLGRLLGVTGVSGSGKSTLVHDSLSRSLTSLKSEQRLPPCVREVQGAENIDKMIEVDQSPIGRSVRSIPATYLGVWDEIRKVFAQSRDAKQKGFQASQFSFNAGAGRCEQCGGLGRTKLEMSFLADVFVPCSQCRGERFNRSTLSVRFKGKNVSDCLSLNVVEAIEFFGAFPKIREPLEMMNKVGLGYLTLGQPANTLSGGESQRMKLAYELSQKDSGRTLYLLDEPTTGLHNADVDRLISVMQELVDKGNTVLVVEHHMDVIRCCDWMIDMGPGAGNQGGTVCYAGPPHSIHGDSPTALYLKNAISRA